MSRDDREGLDWLRLLSVREMTVGVIRDLMEHYEWPGDVFRYGRSDVRRVVGAPLAERLFSDEAENRFEAARAWLEKTPGAGFATFIDPDFPKNLLTTEFTPTVIFYRGNRKLLDMPKVQFVGADSADDEGLENAASFAKAVADCGRVVVTGCLNALECTASGAALRKFGRSIVVSATAPDRVYPAANRKDVALVAQTGLLVSPFFPGEPFVKENLEYRSRIAGALADVTLVVESCKYDEAFYAARRAAEVGRDICAIPGSIHNPNYKGCHELIKVGARLVECTGDFLR